MSDDLKKRLRQHRYNTWNDDLGPEPDKALAADRIEELELALTRSRAETAVAYEWAAQIMDDHGDGAVTGALGEQLCCSGHMCGCRGDDVGSYLQYRIRTLATPEQSAALDAVKAEARAQGMREAAEITRCAFDSRPLLGRCFEWNDGYDDGTRAAKEDILAAIQKGGA